MDILLTDNNNAFVNDLIVKFNSVFSLKDLYDLSYFLRVEVTLSSDGLHLSQTKYIKELLDKI